MSEHTVKVPASQSVETTQKTETTGSFFGSTTKSTVSRVVNHVKEFHWKINCQWEVSIYSGTKVTEKRVLQERSSSTVLVIQTNDAAPIPEHRQHDPVDVSLTWLLKHVDLDELSATFRIDTQDSETKTPLVNESVKDMVAFLQLVTNWSNRVKHHFQDFLEQVIVNKHNPADGGNKPNLTSLRNVSGKNIFVPIQPLMEENTKEQSDTVEAKSVLSLPKSDSDSTNVLLSANDMYLLLNEQIRSIQEQMTSLQKAYPARQLNKLVSSAEATVVVLTDYLTRLVQGYGQAMEYIQEMLEKQLVSAIGKRVQASDLDQFVRFHNNKLLSPPPQPFCHAIRRPQHYPDGVLSIERPNGDGKMEPIDTLCRLVDTTDSLKVALNAATTIELTGNKYLHGWMQHRFGTELKEHVLTARARQFSSFLLVVGTMTGPNQLEPKDVIILQNKDEVMIPLLLEELPTAKEFKDAIKSLSPEQQRFAKAFRSMQLESSVFGVCVIQIKPQLEELLGLPGDSLTKEMKLTQDLMELFVDYQVPSDMLYYDGDTGSSPKEKVDNVRGHVKAVLDVIQEAKKKQLEEQTMRADMTFERAHEEMEEMMADEAYGSGPVMRGKSAKSGGGRGGRRAKKAGHHMKMSLPLPTFQAASMEAPAPMMVQASMAAPAPMMAQTMSMAAPEMQMELAHDAMDDGAYLEDNMVAEEASLPSSPTKLKPGNDEGVGETPGGVVDFTRIPKMLDSSIEEHAKDSALRATIIKASNRWTRKRQANLLTKTESSGLGGDDIKAEKDKAVDLLDALSRSGSLPIACSELHVLVSVTHCFERSVMDTVLLDNVNPIEKLEMSTLLVASTIHGVPATQLLHEGSESKRLKSAFPSLMAD